MSKSKKIETTPTKSLKDATVTIRISHQWEQYIEQTAAALTEKMETEITKTWVITQLMKSGLTDFEKKHNIKRKKADESKAS